MHAATAAATLQTIQIRQPLPKLSGEAIREIVAYLWSIKYFDAKANAKSG